MSDIKPPFTLETARLKVKAAQAAWNTRKPAQIALAYTPDSVWRNRGQFVVGRAEIERFLTAKWARELDYRLRKELFAWEGDRIAVQFWYEYRDGDEARATGRERWFRCYGLEHWTFAPDGRMHTRMMSGNDVELGVGGPGGDRWFVGDVLETEGDGPGQGVNRITDAAALPDGHHS